MAHLKIKLPLLILTTIIAFPLVCLFLFTYITTPNTYILNQDFSLLSQKEIITQIDQSFNLPPVLVFHHPTTKDITIPLASISAQINPSSTASKLLIANPWQKIIFWRPSHHQLDISLNQPALDQLLSNIASQVNKPYVPGQIVMDKNKLSFSPASLGQQLDTSTLTSQIISHLSHLDASPLALPINQIGFNPTIDQIDQILALAGRLQGRSLSLLIDNQDPYSVSDQTLISWLDFSTTPNLAKITDFVSTLNTSLKTDPVDAIFQFENNRVSQFRSSQPGRFVDQPQLITQINQVFPQLLASDNPQEITIPFLYIEPMVKNEDVNNLGIKQLLGRGQSSFKHSSTIRNLNVKRGAEVVNYILVPPGDTFSFIENLGPVNTDNGYHMAYIIREGRTELDVGGGICQVSTTLFRAALNAGLPIIERQPHAYRVSYYEEGSRPGFDATVFIPKPDLRFQNRARAALQ